MLAGGFTTRFPTGKSSLSENVYAAGPAATAAYVGEDWTFGVLGQHWWDYSKQGDRGGDDFNFTRLQLFYFNRYFSPRQHNQPRTLEGIFKLNDVELFDLKADPDETQNLTVEPKKHGDLLLAMNDKMNAFIDAEIGEPDDGRILPGEDANWAAATFDPLARRQPLTKTAHRA